MEVRIKLSVVLGLASLLLLSCSSEQEEISSEPITLVEIRLAAREPQSEFLEMIVTGSGDSIYVSPDVILSNGDIESAQVVQDKQGKPAIEILLNQEGSEKFADFTSQHIGEMAAILVGGDVVSAPVIRAEISGGRAMINGDFTEAEATELAESIVPGK